MRADRLLSLLMLLQARGRQTARQLAQELEVSERTIYRDVDALSAAGVPVYGERGTEGGFALLDSYRTTLTGLTEDEVRALFMLNIPSPLEDLGVSQKLRAAMLKLAASLPAARRSEEALVNQRIYLDSSWWFQGQEPAPHLRTIYDAVWQERKLYITRRLPWGIPRELTQLVEPYGLVAKAGVWYVVCASQGRVRGHRVAHLADARMAEEHFERPADFDLAAFWQAWCAEFEQSRSYYPVTARVAPHFVAQLPRLFGAQMQERIAQAGPPDEKGRITVELPFESLEEARARLLGLGRAIEVLEPEPLRLSIMDHAAQILEMYGER